MGPSSQRCSQRGVTTAGNRRGVRSPALHVQKQASDPCWEPSLAAGRAPLHGWAAGKQEERQGGQGRAEARRPPSFGLRDRGPPAGTCSFPAPASRGGGWRAPTQNSPARSREPGLWTRGRTAAGRPAGGRVSCPGVGEGLLSVEGARIAGSPGTCRLSLSQTG